MKQRRKILIALLSLISCIIFYYILLNEYDQISPIGTNLGEKRLKRDLKHLNVDGAIVKNVSFDSFGKTKDKYKDSPYFWKFEKEIFADTEDSDYIVDVGIQNKTDEDYKKPLEVRQVIKIWLYLHDRIPPQSVSFVEVDLDKSWIMDAQNVVVITKSEFEDLYNSFEEVINNKDENEVINQISDE